MASEPQYRPPDQEGDASGYGRSGEQREPCRQAEMGWSDRDRVSADTHESGMARLTCPAKPIRRLSPSAASANTKTRAATR